MYWYDSNSSASAELTESNSQAAFGDDTEIFNEFHLNLINTSYTYDLYLLESDIFFQVQLVKP